MTTTAFPIPVYGERAKAGGGTERRVVGRMADEVAERHYTDGRAALARTPRQTLDDLIRDAERVVRDVEFTGPEAAMAHDLVALEAELLAAVERVREARKGHQHQWDERDYCSVCGADGRA